MVGEASQEEALKFQNYYQQLQSVLVQKETLRLQESEMKLALKELEKSEEKSAYKLVGNVLILKPKEKLVEELKEGIESVRAKISSLEKMENFLSQKLEELQKKLKP